MIIYTSKIYKRIINKLDNIIKKNQNTIPDEFYYYMISMKLWDKWVELVSSEGACLSINQRRELAFPKFVIYCKSKCTDGKKIP